MAEYMKQDPEVEPASRLGSSEDDRLGIVPAPSDTNRCAAISRRSGDRCKRYRQAGSTVCSKHASSVEQSMGHCLNPRESGLDARTAERAAAIQTLDEIIASKKSLASDRIRAVEAKQRILAREQEAQAEERYGPLVALKHALDSLPEGERVAALTSLLSVQCPTCDTPNT